LGLTSLKCLTCLLPFLEQDIIDSLPYVIANAITVLPTELYQDIVNHLCFYILPFTLGRKEIDQDQDNTDRSISAIIMVILEYSEDFALHRQLLECFMIFKSGIMEDILNVVAYGTNLARRSATRLLFYYWPTIDQDQIYDYDCHSLYLT
ncbi:hypothetical protein QAD02_007631, partial [Eretmocerus hayati]